MIGHVVACYGAADRHLGMLAATLGDWDRAEPHFERAMALNRQMGARTWLAHTAYEYGRMLLARGGRATARGAARRGGADSPSGSACARCSPGSARSARRAPCAGPPDGLSFREVQILGLVAERPEQPRDRRDAVHQRAHRGEPHPQHPAQDRLREPHRGGVLRAPPRAGRRGAGRIGAMPLYVIEREFAEELELDERRRPADRRDQCRRGRPLAVLVPERGPAPHLLPLRGAVAGGDPRRRPAGERAGRRDRRGQPGLAGADAALARLGGRAGRRLVLGRVRAQVGSPAS